MGYLSRSTQFFRQFLLGILVCLSVTMLSAIAIPLPAMAALCQTTTEHQICIVDVQRSAKNYWEYRAIVKIDAETRPIEVYNCRDRTRTRSDGQVVPFEPTGAGPLICRTLNRS